MAIEPIGGYIARFQSVMHGYSPYLPLTKGHQHHPGSTKLCCLATTCVKNLPESLHEVEQLQIEPTTA